MPDHRALRQAIRARRRQIAEPAARQQAMQLAKNAINHPLLLNSRRIASYLACDGEMDPLPLMQQLWSLRKIIYLPVLSPFNNNRLWFARFEPGDTLVYNRYGIPEPVRRRLTKPTALDLVLTPLVAFDTHGHRVGMGGGFYDRSFAFLRRRTHWKQPRLLGIAYELQKRQRLGTDQWDVPLDAIVTEKQFYSART